METIGIVDVESRLTELLDRTLKGETFHITANGRAMGNLVPPDKVPDPKAVAAAVEGLLSFRGVFKGLDLNEPKHEGHRF